MKIWSVEEEAENLRARFQGVNRAAFARENNIPGGQAMVYQHVTGRRPLNLEAATAYAAGFGCSLADISPRLAIEAGKAAALSSEASPGQANTPYAWPFPSIDESEIRGLPESQLRALEGAIALAVAQLKIGITVSNQAPTSGVKASSRTANLDSAADEFPMRIPGLPPGPSQIKEPVPAYAAPRLSLEQAVAVNVAPGEHHAANDKFEKVPELADVRLAAGEGIENLTEEMTGYVYFRRSFLRSVGADGQRGRMVYAKGDSMEPVIRDGA
ncbi:S24 family peptidase, partial [Bordetella avium]|uniref:S24 family peptidase n=1 Tax=Bordetella avium TaxID=521 RepID=UPI00217568D4